MNLQYFKMNYGIKGFEKQFGWNPLSDLKSSLDTDPNLNLKRSLGEESYFLYCLVTDGKLTEEGQKDVISRVSALWKQLQSL